MYRILLVDDEILVRDAIKENIDWKSLDCELVGDCENGKQASEFVKEHPVDIVLTDKRLHCASHNIQFTCIADGSGVAFMETMDIFSLFGNILDNAIECESLQPPEMRFIHLSVRTVNRMLTIHAENHFEDSLQFKDGLPVTTKADKDSHGYGMMSVRHIVEKYNGSFSISTQDKLFQIDIIMPIPCDDTGRSAG